MLCSFTVFIFMVPDDFALYVTVEKSFTMLKKKIKLS